MRLANETGTYAFFILAVLSGMSHLLQANITDYYKTLHLYFISKDKGAEFQSLEQVVAQHKEMKYGITKFFYFLYRWYTLIQVKATPTLQLMLKNLHAKYGDDFPQDVRLDFRRQSKQLMKMIDLMTFNGRTLIMFIIVGMTNGFAVITGQRFGAKDYEGVRRSVTMSTILSTVFTITFTIICAAAMHHLSLIHI